MHVAVFISELQHFKSVKPSYLSTCKWAISLFRQTRSQIVLLTFVFISMIAIGCYFRLLLVLGIFVSIVNLYM